MLRKSSTQGRHAPAEDGQVLFIGNATLLIRFGSLAILTDPNFVGRDAEVPLGFGLSAVRTTDPAIEADELAQPDLVIVSHDHGDHFDDVAADWLDAAVPVVTCPAAARRIEEKGFNGVRALETWTSTELVKEGTRVRVTAVPARHASGPLAFALPEVMGSVLELWRDWERADAGAGRHTDERPADLVIYISGDTLLDDRMGRIADRFPRIDLAFIHMGGMRVLGMTLTLDAEQGVQLLNLLHPRLAIPIHYNDYVTSSSALPEFVARVKEAGLSKRVRYLRHGEVWPLAVTGRPNPPPA